MEGERRQGRGFRQFLGSAMHLCDWREGFGSGGAVHNRACARANSAALGQAEAIATLMLRTETRTWAPIFRSFNRILPQVASARRVYASPIRRKAQISTYIGHEANNSLS